MADGAHRFFPDTAHAIQPLGNEGILVLADSGIWLHDADTLERLARLVEPPVGSMAVSSDASLLAFSRHPRDLSEDAYKAYETWVEIEIVSVPDLSPVARISRVRPPFRMEFSDDRRWLSAVSLGDDVMLADLESGTRWRYEVPDPVYDGQPLPGYPGYLAFVDSDDDFRVYRMEDGVEVFRDHRSANLWALSVDSESGNVWVGGDDNDVHLLRMSTTGADGPQFVDDGLIAALDDNVRAAACCIGGT
ncbi:MAG: hypothetical protein KC561_21245, partial [Myxococcales bacterium]|nr:hypothetical protein [Myxococcales bacterium]